MKRQQDLPEDAFFSCEEAENVFSKGNRSVLVLSYGWHTATEPDPTGYTLTQVRRYLESEPSTKGCALFWDYACRKTPRFRAV